MNNGDVSQYRKAADHVWDMARKYERKGAWDLASELKSLATHLHNLAREKEGTDPSSDKGNKNDG